MTRASSGKTTARGGVEEGFGILRVRTVTAALAIALASALVARAAPSTSAAPAEPGNGAMGSFLGAGDPAAGEGLYKQRCASCHDAPNPPGRIPAKAAIANNTPTMIVSTLLE